MKKSIVIVVASLVSFMACKKREVFPAEEIPSAQRVRIAEITDSLNQMLSSHQRFYYDDANRVIRTERTDAYYTHARQFEYANGMLSAIKWPVIFDIATNSATLYSGITIERNSLGLITKLSVYPETIYLFTYDDSHNLTRMTINGYEGDGFSYLNPPDTTTYTNYVNDRFTLSRQKVNNSSEIWEQYSRNAQGRPESTQSLMYSKKKLECHMIPIGDELREICTYDYVGTDSLRQEFEYFPLSNLEKVLFNENEEVIKKYYSPNLDVYALVLAPYFPELLPHCSSSKSYPNNLLRVQSSYTIDRTNHQHLPTRIVGTHLGTTLEEPAVLKPSYTTTRTIRYEID